MDDLATGLFGFVVVLLVGAVLSESVFTRGVRCLNEVGDVRRYSYSCPPGFEFIGCQGLFDFCDRPSPD